jgi:sialate O-acetylesterase
MVLQRELELPVWGTADSAETVTVRFGAQEKRATADPSGHWKVTLDSLPATVTPAKLTVSGKNTVEFSNVLVGEVWLCSGQSNMEMAVDAPAAGAQPATKWSVALAEEVKGPAQAAIRLFRVEKKLEPPDVVTAGWQECNGEARAKFSAIGYVFARELNKALGVPIGVMQSAWGGSRIEPWTPRDAYATASAFAKEAATESLSIDGVEPGKNYEAMVQPLAPFAMRGVLWYQGESNIIACNDGLRYADKMRVLIDGWRKAWHREDLPFYYVQVAPYLYSQRKKDAPPHDEFELPKLWEAQARALAIAGTAMVPTNDLVDDPRNIHPGKKEIVAQRLAEVALARIYGKGKGPALPMFEGAVFRGNDAVVHLRDTDGGLKSADGRELNEFEIAGSDGVFTPAVALLGEDRSLVTASSEKVSNPTTVRFAWHESSRPNLVTREGWPVYPFSSDISGPLPATHN